MNNLRSITFIWVAIFAMAMTAFGRRKPVPIDAESISLEYFKLFDSENQEEDFYKWAATRSETELSILPIIIGLNTLDMVDDCLTDSLHYDLCLSAVSLIDKGVAYIEKSGNNDAMYVTTSQIGLMPLRFVLANAYDIVYKYLEADSAYIQTTRDISRDFGPDSEEFVFWTNQCAERLQRKNKDYDRAINLLLPAKEAALHSPDVSDSTACEFLLSLAQKYQFSGKDDEAKLLALEAEKRTGNNNRLISNVSTMLGELYCTSGDHDLGNVYFKKARDNAPSVPEFFAVGVNYANKMRETGFRDLAETTLLELGDYLGNAQLSQIDLFNYFESLGVLYTFTDPEKPSDYFRKAEEYIDACSYTDVIRHVLNSQVYPHEENSFKVISALDRAEGIFNMLVGSDQRLLNELLLLKGRYLIEVRDYTLARRYLEVAYGRMFDYSHEDPQFLSVLRYLIRLEEIAGEDIRRCYYLNEQLRNSISHGETSDLYMAAVADVLHFCLQTNDCEGAQFYLNIYSKVRPDDFDTRCYEYRLKKLEGKISEAEEKLNSMRTDFPERRADVDLMFQRFCIENRSQRIADVSAQVLSDFKNQLLRQLLFMSTDERRNMNDEIKSRRDEIISAISFAPDLAELALDYSLFSKGLLFHTRNSIAVFLADKDSARLEMALIHELKANLSQAINSCDTRRAQSLQSEIDSRERYLVDDYVDFKGLSDQFERYSVARLRESLAAADIMVDFVEYGQGDKSHIGCFVVEKESPVRFIDFGEKPALTQGNIGKTIWEKILSDVSPGRKIFFSADGILNTLPIEFAVGDDGEPICGNRELHRVFHLSDIRPGSGIGNRVEVIGVADHNSPLGHAVQFEDIYRGNWTDLPEVETELYHISNSIHNEEQCHISFNDDATEKYVKSLSGLPITTLHISTHGFYLNEDELTHAFNDPADFHHNMARRLLKGNRTSAAGLVMRNGNLSWKSEIVSEGEDNILTAEEIETLSFPELNLTVLSACESGLGSIDSEGVWGLRRAFRIAGSRNLICALNKVNDYWTTQFMDIFYGEAAKGKTIYESFRTAQKTLYEIIAVR